MSSLPLITKDQLESLPKRAVVEFYMKLQQIALMAEDEADTLKRIIAAQQELLKIAGIEIEGLKK